MVYYTSDLHFGHESVLAFCGRPWKTADEMNAALIDNWNKTVQSKDDVYILGDLFFRCSPETVRCILKQLKGRKHLIVGNHDSSWLTKFDAAGFFAEITAYLERSLNHHGVVLSHYPMLTYRHEKRFYMIHGHLHNDTSADFWPLLCIRERVLNAGVDINGFRPVTFEELIENNRRWKCAHMPDQSV